VDIVSTFLGAHAVPPELDAESYTDLLINEMIPQVADAGLAEFCDVFCEEGYFSAKQSRRILQAGIEAGLAPKIHTDEYAEIGGSAVAAQLPAISADHLNYTPPGVMEQLASAGVIGVVMPALDFAVAHPRPFDFAAMKAAGMTLALATDICPGCWCESMQVVMQLACRNHGFTPEEALLASTIHGARAISRSDDRGSLEVGKLADVLILDVPTLEEVIYRLGNNAIGAIIRRGQRLGPPAY
jgi:imidazolonepropionase